MKIVEGCRTSGSTRAVIHLLSSGSTIPVELPVLKMEELDFNDSMPKSSLIQATSSIVSKSRPMRSNHSISIPELIIADSLYIGEALFTS